MAHSSPGQLRKPDSLDPTSISGRLSDPMGDGMHESRNVDSPFENQELVAATRSSPGKNKQSQQSVSPEKAFGYNGPNDHETLLERPLCVLKPPDLDKDYQFGPAIQLAPDQFTKRPIKPSPLYGDDRLHHFESIPPPHPGREVPNSWTFPVAGTVHAGKYVSNRFPISGALSRPGQPQKETQVSTNHTVNKLPASSEAAGVTKASGKPPYPDSSPSEEVELLTHPQTCRIGARRPVSPGKMQTKAQNPGPGLVKMTEHATTPKHPPTKQEARECDLDVGRPRSPGYDQRTPRANSEKGEKHNKYYHSPAPAPGRSRVSVCETTGRDWNQMVTRPVREVAHGKASKPTSLPRPTSRSSNVSKQR